MIPKWVMWEGPFAGRLPFHVRKLVGALTDVGVSSRTVALDDESVTLALNEGVGPLLGARLAAEKVTVPSGRRDELLWAHKVCAAFNLLRARAVDLLVERCGKNAIPVLLLKGMALLEAGLGPGERSMGDVDVLVPPSRWQETCRLAIDAGFKSQDDPARSFTTAHDYVRSFSHPELGVVEIHRYLCEETLFSPDYEGDDGLFARASVLPSGARIPERGDLFLTLVAHAAKHTFDLPLRSYLDGVTLMQGGGISPPSLALRARAWDMETAYWAWMDCLRRLAGNEGSPHDFRQRHGRRLGAGTLGRLVWMGTRHESPWQRFIRLWWLTDSAAQWTQHVATRSWLRTRDALSNHGRTPRGDQVADHREV